jgi:hypothetical protein
LNVPNRDTNFVGNPSVWHYVYRQYLVCNHPERKEVCVGGYWWDDTVPSLMNDLRRMLTPSSISFMIYNSPTCACDPHPPFSYLFVLSTEWFAEPVASTLLLGTYFTGSCIISVLHYVICIYWCVISNLLHTLISFLFGWWHTTYYLHISFITHQN